MGRHRDQRQKDKEIQGEWQEGRKNDWETHNAKWVMGFENNRVSQRERDKWFSRETGTYTGTSTYCTPSLVLNLEKQSGPARDSQAQPNTTKHRASKERRAGSWWVSGAWKRSRLTSDSSYSTESTQHTQKLSDEIIWSWLAKDSDLVAYGARYFINIFPYSS